MADMSLRELSPGVYIGSMPVRNAQDFERFFVLFKEVLMEYEAAIFSSPQTLTDLAAIMRRRQSPSPVPPTPPPVIPPWMTDDGRPEKHCISDSPKNLSSSEIEQEVHCNEPDNHHLGSIDDAASLYSGGYASLHRQRLAYLCGSSVCDECGCWKGPITHPVSVMSHADENMFFRESSLDLMGYPTSPPPPPQTPDHDLHSRVDHDARLFGHFMSTCQD